MAVLMLDLFHVYYYFFKQVKKESNLVANIQKPDFILKSESLGALGKLSDVATAQHSHMAALASGREWLPPEAPPTAPSSTQHPSLFSCSLVSMETKDGLRGLHGSREVGESAFLCGSERYCV